MKHIFTGTLFTFATITTLFGQEFTCGDTLVDTRDGQKYATVLIGSDCWFKQNLNYGSTVISDSLGVIHSQQTNNGIPEKYAQNNDTNNLQVYGGLYEHAELMNYSTDTQGLCPDGWHVSSDEEWANLIDIAGGTMTSSSAGIGGNSLKAIGEGIATGIGTDAVGISLRHGGDRDGFGIFYGIGLRAIYWTSTASGQGQAYHYTLWAENDTIQRLSLGTVTTGFSCRCVKDNTAGIHENSIEGSLEIFPNPANSVINIQVNNFSGQVILLNSIGQQLKKMDISSQKSSFQFEISDLQSGIYFMQLVNSDGEIIALEKFIAE